MRGPLPPKQQQQQRQDQPAPVPVAEPATPERESHLPLDASANNGIGGGTLDLSGSSNSKEDSTNNGIGESQALVTAPAMGGTLDLRGSSDGVGDSTSSAALPPTPTSAEGREWDAWMRKWYGDVRQLRRLDSDALFSKPTKEAREAVAANFIKMKAYLDNSQFTQGLRYIHPEIQEMAERAGFHFGFFSLAYQSRVTVAIVLFFICAYICAVASMVAGHRTPFIQILDLRGVPTGRYTLPDSGHDLTEFILGKLGYSDAYVNAHHLPDTIVAWVSCFTMAFVLAHPRRFLIIRRALIIFAILFFFRAFTVTVTSLPDASPVCRAQFLNGAAYKSQPMFPRSFVRAFRFMLSPTTTVSCGDMVFSGHTTVLTMCSMIFWKYCRGKYVCTKVFIRSFHIPEWACMVMRKIMYLINIIGAMVIVSTRFHYTLDVAIGLYLTQRTFRWYHDAAMYPKLLRDTPLANFLRWMEAEDILAIDKAAYNLYRKKT